jgi:DNA-binding GntR family transcriptional regulator
MAADLSAAERAHQATKRLILEGKLAVRSRIDVERLARSLGLSSMPVRQALNALVWERLVRTGRHGAYEVALWSEAELIELYEWRGDLLALCLPLQAAASDLKRSARLGPYAQAVFEVMRRIDAHANGELRRAAINADERLTAARLIEAEVLGDVEGEFETLAAALGEGSRRSSALLKSFTKRRVERARAIREHVALRALPSNGA